MARIELRYCTIRLKDGLAGTAVVSQNSPPMAGDTTLGVSNVSLNTFVTDRIPINARFTLSSENVDSTIHTVTARTPTQNTTGEGLPAFVEGTTPNVIGPGTTAIAFTPALGAGVYSGTGYAEVGAVTETTAGTSSVNEVQSIAKYVSTVTSGEFILGFSLTGPNSVNPDGITVPGGYQFFTDGILYSATGAVIQAAVDAAALALPVPNYTAGDIAITGGPLTTAAVTVTYSGDSVQNSPQPLVSVIDDTLMADTVGIGTLNFLPIALVIKVGDGDLKYTENHSYKYDLDRGILDTVRIGDDVPLDLTTSFTYEHITTGTNETVSPVDFIKQRGPASEFVSSDPDQCQPFAVDFEITFQPPCGSSQPEVTVFPDFRAEKVEPDFKNSIITLTGKCHCLEPLVYRTIQP